jgi:hypothetical protein
MVSLKIDLHKGTLTKIKVIHIIVFNRFFFVVLVTFVDNPGRTCERRNVGMCKPAITEKRQDGRSPESGKRYF